MRVLFVEDDTNLQTVLCARLSQAGFAVDGATTAAAARSLCRHTTYNLAVLDLHLPDATGEALVEPLRACTPDLPILLLTVTDDAETKVRLLDAGVDDYLTKPFLFEELVARMRALLRRPPAIVPDVRTAHGVVLDGVRHTVARDGAPLHLTRTEFMLLSHLLGRRGFVVSRDELIAHVWGEHADPFSNVIDTHMANVRRKLGAPAIIHTVRGCGYSIG